MHKRQVGRIIHSLFRNSGGNLSTVLDYYLSKYENRFHKKIFRRIINTHSKEEIADAIIKVAKVDTYLQLTRLASFGYVDDILLERIFAGGRYDIINRIITNSEYFGDLITAYAFANSANAFLFGSFLMKNNPPITKYYVIRKYQKTAQDIVKAYLDGIISNAPENYFGTIFAYLVDHADSNIFEYMMSKFPPGSHRELLFKYIRRITKTQLLILDKYANCFNENWTLILNDAVFHSNTSLIKYIVSCIGKDAFDSCIHKYSLLRLLIRMYSDMQTRFKKIFIMFGCPKEYLSADVIVACYEHGCKKILNYFNNTLHVTINSIEIVRLAGMNRDDDCYVNAIKYGLPFRIEDFREFMRHNSCSCQIKKIIRALNITGRRRFIPEMMRLMVGYSACISEFNFGYKLLTVAERKQLWGSENYVKYIINNRINKRFLELALSGMIITPKLIKSVYSSDFFWFIEKLNFIGVIDLHEIITSPPWKYIDRVQLHSEKYLLSLGLIIPGHNDEYHLKMMDHVQESERILRDIERNSYEDGHVAGLPMFYRAMKHRVSRANRIRSFVDDESLSDVCVMCDV